KILKMVEKATKEMKYHPYMLPSANMSQEYTNPDGEKMGACQYCAFCERFACEYSAKASPEVTVIPTAEKTGNYTIRTEANVVEIIKDGNNKVKGVKFVDTVTKEEFIQPADVVVLTSYMLNNYKLLRISDI